MILLNYNHLKIFYLKSIGNLQTITLQFISKNNTHTVKDEFYKQNIIECVLFITKFVLKK